MTVLVLAGTSEAARLCARLVELDIDVVASLAGRTESPRPLPCPTRVGGFGGVDGLVAELRTRGVRALIDATHPFADEMPAHARDAAAIAGIPHLRLVRPAWASRPGWTEVDDVTHAARHAHGRTVLTLGRQELDAFRQVDAELIVRSVDSPPPGPWRAVTARGPFSYDDELALLHDADVLVTRNSGGPTTKLDAADALGVHVVVINRPPPVDAPTVGDVEAALNWIVAIDHP